MPRSRRPFALRLALAAGGLLTGFTMILAACNPTTHQSLDAPARQTPTGVPKATALPAVTSPRVATRTVNATPTVSSSPGTKAFSGTVSSPNTGAAPIHVPNFVGQNYQAAQYAAALLGLNISFIFEPSPLVPAGLVITQTPPAGQQAGAFTNGTFTVSIGPNSIPGAQPCGAQDLQVKPAPRVSEATGQHTSDFSFTNVSASACVLDGYPGAVLSDSAGRVLPFVYSHSGDQMTTNRAPRAANLPKGGIAWLRLNKYRCDIPGQDAATNLRLTLPSDGGSLDLPVSVGYCSETPSLTVTVSPFEPVRALLSPAEHVS